MNRVIYFLVILSLIQLVSVSVACSQSHISFDIGRVHSKFRFMDSHEIKEQDLKFNQGTNLKLCYSKIFNKGIFFRGGIGLRKSGANLKIETLKINWTFWYADLFVGLGYTKSLGKFNPYFCILPFYSSLIKAEQQIGLDVYDLRSSKSIKPTDVGFIFLPGVRFSMNENVSLFVEGSYLLGLRNIEANPGQKLFNRLFSYNLGVALAINKPPIK